MEEKSLKYKTQIIKALKYKTQIIKEVYIDNKTRALVLAVSCFWVYHIIKKELHMTLYQIENTINVRNEGLKWQAVESNNIYMIDKKWNVTYQ